MAPSIGTECSKPIMNFHKKVKTFLGLLRTEKKITRFRLKCNNNSHDYCSRYTEEWVSAVVARKVERVNISLCMNMCHTSVLSFSTLFTCTTIVTLNLKGPFDLSIPCSSVHQLYLFPWQYIFHIVFFFVLFLPYNNDIHIFSGLEFLLLLFPLSFPSSIVRLKCRQGLWAFTP